VTSFVLVPLWQRYHNRYSQYLPLETISNQTLSLGARIRNAIVRIAVSTSWRAMGSRGVVVADRNSFDSEDGEELGAVNEAAARRAMGRQRGGNIDTTPRLSRE
jgi:hypothetical protein